MGKGLTRKLCLYDFTSFFFNRSFTLSNYIICISWNCRFWITIAEILFFMSLRFQEIFIQFRNSKIPRLRIVIHITYLTNILLTGSNNQFRKYESEFSRIFLPIRTSHSILVHYRFLFRNNLIMKIQVSYFQNWLLDPMMSQIIHKLILLLWFF